MALAGAIGKHAGGTAVELDLDAMFKSFQEDIAKICQEKQTHTPRNRWLETKEPNSAPRMPVLLCSLCLAARGHRRVLHQAQIEVRAFCKRDHRDVTACALRYLRATHGPEAAERINAVLRAKKAREIVKELEAEEAARAPPDYGDSGSPK